MSLVSTQRILGPCAWRGADLADDDSWIHVLSPQAIDEIDRALATVKARGLRFPEFTAADFPLPGLHADLTRHADEHLPYHSDPSDVVGLLCLRKARTGGLSSLVSVATIYNDILERHREYLGLYYRPMYFAHLCEPQPSLSPIFSVHLGKLSCRYLRQYIELGHEIRNQPLSRVEVEALDLFDDTIHQADIRLDMMLEPGDLQFANNYAVLHSRTAFEDDPDPARHRKMLRLWLKMPNARALAPEFPGRNGFPDNLAI
jgi:hypothetical protein